MLRLGTGALSGAWMTGRHLVSHRDYDFYRSPPATRRASAGVCVERANLIKFSFDNFAFRAIMMSSHEVSNHQDLMTAKILLEMHPEAGWPMRDDQQTAGGHAFNNLTH